MSTTNWAGNLTYGATVVHHPRSVAELAEVVARAPRIRALGSRHCFNDLADSAELVSLDRLAEEIEVDAEARTVRVGGGVRYGTLATDLHRRGWAVHTMASLPHISVAGAVATATHGSGDRSGNLASAVRGLEMVTSDGTQVHLTTRAELDGAVVGLGALGVVTALTLAVEPTFDVAQQVDTLLPWEVALEHLDEITASADSVSLFTDWTGDTVAQVWRKTRVPTGSPAGAVAEPRRFGATPATVEVHPLPDVDPRATTAQLGVPGPWHERLPHFRMEFTPSHGDELQSEYLVPREHAAAALRSVRAIADRVAPLLLVSEVRTVAADQLWMSTAYRRPSVALHFTWRPGQGAVEAVLPTLERALAPFDPRPHWGKLFTADGAGAPERIAELYPRLGDFRSLVARTDPRGAFRNAFLDRHGLTP